MADRQQLPCWTRESLGETVFSDIGAAPLDAGFLLHAVQHPVRVVAVEGAQLSDNTERGVAQLLLSDVGTQTGNTIIALTGQPGTGKSLLVRWIKQFLTTDEALTVYVPREVASLHAIVNRLLDELPATDLTSKVRDEFSRAVVAKPRNQLAYELLANIRSTIAFARDLPLHAKLLGSEDEIQGRTGGINSWLASEPITKHLLRPNGTIQRIVASLTGDRSGGDEETPAFTTEDVLVVRAGDPLLSSLSPAARTAARVINNDREAAVALLRDVTNRAIASTLGMRAEVSIARVFEDTRRALRQQGRELILLFEDLAQFGLFDGDIFNQFMIQPGTEFAPIRAIYAITDHKYQELVPEATRDRQSYRLEIVPLDLKNPQLAAQFVARYLNSARLGFEALGNAWQERPGHRDWVPNACFARNGGEPCAFQQTCHEAFGVVDIGLEQPVGLFPHNQLTISRSLRQLEAIRPDLTPRSVVQNLVEAVLKESELPLETNQFPAASAAERFGTDTTEGLLKQMVVPQASGLSEADRERVWRARTVWFDGHPESEAFRTMVELPDVDHGYPRDHTLDMPASDGTEAPPPKGTDLTQHLGAGPMPELAAWEALSPESTGPSLMPTTVSDIRRKLRSQVLSRIDWTGYLLNTQSGSRFTQTLRTLVPEHVFVIKPGMGQDRGTGDLAFEVSNDASGVMLLTGLLWFTDHGHWDFSGRLPLKWRPPRFDPEALRLHYEMTIQRWADDTLRYVLTHLRWQEGGVASTLAALRALSLVVLGSNVDSNDLSTLAVHDAHRPTVNSESCSPRWRGIRALAERTLETIDLTWITDFSSYVQGRGEPSVIQGRLLSHAIARVLDDPAGFLEETAPWVSVGDEAHQGLLREWQTNLPPALADEGKRLIHVLTRLDALQTPEASASENLSTRVSDAARLVTQAINAGMDLENSQSLIATVSQDLAGTKSPARIDDCLPLLPALIDGEARTWKAVRELQGHMDALATAEGALDFVEATLESIATTAKVGESSFGVASSIDFSGYVSDLRRLARNLENLVNDAEADT